MTKTLETRRQFNKLRKGDILSYDFDVWSPAAEDFVPLNFVFVVTARIYTGRPHKKINYIVADKYDNFELKGTPESMTLMYEDVAGMDWEGAR